MKGFLVLILAGVALATVIEKRVVSDASSRNALCNDGTPAIYYTKYQPGSAKWLFYLEGGGGCSNHAMCSARNQTNPELMTSNGWNATLDYGAVFDEDCKKNPAFCQSSKVFIHYCTSDWWSGRNTSSIGGLSFLGRNIPMAVLEDIWNDHASGLQRATQFIISGTSAGAVGVWSNANDIADFLKQKLPSIDIRAVPDSGWFLGGDGLVDWPCENHLCSIETQFFLGSKIWGFSPDNACGNKFHELNYHCLFGPVAFPFMKMPTLPIMFFTDLYQAVEDGIPVADPQKLTANETDWILFREKQVRRSFPRDHPKFLWAASCYFHGLLCFDDAYYQITVGQMNAPTVINAFINNKIPPGSYVEDQCDTIACNPTCMTYPPHF